MSILSQELDISGLNFPQTDLKIGRLFYKTDTKLLYGYDGVTWTQIQGTSGGGVLERDNIIPTGSVNGVNITYTLPEQFYAGSLVVSRNGLLLQNGVDFFEQPGIPGFTMASAPLTGSILISFYSLTATATIPTKVAQSFVATAGQTVFNLNFSYTPGSGGLEVYSTGLRQLITTDYAETNSTTVTFSSGRQVGEIVQFIGTGIQPNLAHGSTHNWTSSDPIRIPFSSASSYPSSPLAGQPAYRTDVQTFSFFNGVTWIVTQGSGEFTRVEITPSGLVNGANTIFTLAENYVPGSLIVTRNGLTLKSGVDYAEQPTQPGFTMTVAPQVNDTLLAFYKLQATFLGNQLAELRQDYVLPTGATDGANITYTLPSTFVAGTLMVTRNGLVLDNGIDFFESQSLPGFTMTVPPASNATLNAFYRIANGVVAPALQRQTIVATSNQTVFALNFSYTMNTGGLVVYSGGLIMVNGVDYTETNQNTVTFFTGRQLNENVSFISTGVAPNFAHASTHNIGGSDPISIANLVGTTRVVTASGAIAVLSTDYRIIVRKAASEATFVNLMSSPLIGEQIIIKDGKGDALTNPIIIQPAAGTIDGNTNLIISTNHAAVILAYDGTQWGAE